MSESESPPTTSTLTLTSIPILILYSILSFVPEEDREAVRRTCRFMKKYVPPPPPPLLLPPKPELELGVLNIYEPAATKADATPKKKRTRGERGRGDKYRPKKEESRGVDVDVKRREGRDDEKGRTVYMGYHSTQLPTEKTNGYAENGQKEHRRTISAGTKSYTDRDDVPNAPLAMRRSSADSNTPKAPTAMRMSRMERGDSYRPDTSQPQGDSYRPSLQIKGDVTRRHIRVRSNESDLEEGEVDELKTEAARQDRLKKSTMERRLEEKAEKEKKLSEVWKNHRDDGLVLEY